MERPAPSSNFCLQPGFVMQSAQFAATVLEGNSRGWHAAAGWSTCCAGARHACRRLAALCAARAAWYRSRQQQAQEELSASLEQRPMRIVELTRIELPEEVLEEMRGVPAIDLCAACHKQLEVVSVCCFVCGYTDCGGAASGMYCCNSMPAGSCQHAGACLQ